MRNSFGKGGSVPYEEKLGDVVDASPAETDQVVKGEIVGDGDDEEERGSGARIWERGVGRTSEEVRHASAFVELRVRVRVRI